MKNNGILKKHKEVWYDGKIYSCWICGAKAIEPEIFLEIGCKEKEE